MSARNKAINVKISTPKIIEALQQALDKLEVDYTSQAASEKIYDQLCEQWRKDVLALAIANVGIAQNIRSVYRSWNNIMNIDFDVPMDGLILPVEPERNYEVIHSSTYREMKEEIGNAIRILKMTDEEVVSTSTYNSVAKYL
jgi:hypothetical protein